MIITGKQNYIGINLILIDVDITNLDIEIEPKICYNKSNFLMPPFFGYESQDDYEKTDNCLWSFS